MNLWVLGVQVRKDYGTEVATSTAIGYRRCKTEEEARGSFLMYIEKEKPGFSIDTMLCLQVPEPHEDVREAARDVVYGLMRGEPIDADLERLKGLLGIEDC